ncbi:FecR domain-containing protein [Paenibacillus sp. SYP-B3998]|nr:FecR domain-containing protein [Paenibacillus sp. SYP-B3998]
MSLNQGDTLYTGENSTVTLNLSSGDATVTLSDNAEINVSDLHTSGGSEKSKLKIWAGSMWVKVKSLAGSDDEFEVETPTAVMGVRGTQFFVHVDPRTGETKMFVGAGKVSATTVTTNAGSEQAAKVVYLYPTQQISLDSRNEVQDLSLKVELIDLEDFINDASPDVIKALIQNKADIDRENDEFIAKKKKELEEGKETADQTSMFIKDQAALDKVKKNLDNLIGNIAKRALKDQKISKADMNKVIEETNKKISDNTRKLDLDNVQELDKTAGVDLELEKKKQDELLKFEAVKIKKAEDEAKKLDEIKQKLTTILKTAEDANKKIEEANLKVKADEKARAEAELLKKLSDAEKKKFEEARNGGPTSTPTTGTSGGGSSETPTETPKPTISLSAGEQSQTGLFDLDINLSDFNDNTSIYAVEAHLLYDTTISYTNSELVNGTIFDMNNSTAGIKEYKSTLKNELVYVVTNYGANAGNSTGFKGTKKLVTIPMQGFSDGGNDRTATITLEDIIIVRKKGSVLERVVVPKENVKTTITLKGHALPAG